MKNPKPSPIALAVGSALVPQRDAPSCAARFERFVRSAGSVALTLEPILCVIVCLIAFDAVTSVQELEAILHHVPGARKVDEWAFISWTADGKHFRKVLSARTTIALSKLPASSDLSRALQSFLPTLAKIYPCAQGWFMKEVWNNVFRDAQAWLYNILPAYQFSALYGHWNCTLLPDPVLTRKCEFARALFASEDHGATDEAEAVAVDAAFEKEDKAGSQPSYLNELKALFTTPTGGDRLFEMSRPSKDVRSAIQAWFKIKSDNALDFTDPVRAKPLLMLLQVSGATANNVVVRFVCDNPDDRHAVATLMNDVSAINVLSTCQSIFPGVPRVEIVEARTGIPRAYALLTNCRSGSHARVPPASFVMSGFHTLMFLAAVWAGYHSIDS